MLITVVEVKNFYKEFSEELLQNIIQLIAYQPSAGDIIPGSGGIRKLRFSLTDNKGKSGGVRVIYYYYNETKPIYILDIYKKTRKENISKEELNTMKDLVKVLKSL